jgi:hypothetical protein
VSTDLVNTTLADLKGPIEHAFEQKSPMYDLLQKKGRVSTERGTLIERAIMGGSPAQGTGIFGGGETLNMGRTEQTKKIQLQTHRVVVPINIPKLDMLQNDGKLGAIKLVETYTQSVTKLLPVDFDRFFFTGVSHGYVLPTTAMVGWNTLNGQKTFASGKVGVTQGLIEFAAPTSQNDTTQNLAKSPSYNYVNQFGEITSYALDGEDVYDDVYREVAQFNPTDMNAGPDVIFADFDSFAKYYKSQRNQVRIVHVQDNMDKSGNKMELMMGAARFIAAKNLILTDFIGSAASGIAYYLSLPGIEWVWFQKPTMSSFDDRVPNQDVITAKYEMMGAPVITGMRMQGVVVGGARA